MTEQQLCKNCKHLEHDRGCGIWCGIHGNNRNYDCPKFEYNWGILTKEEAINHLNRLYYENKQLKSDNHRLVNETARIVAEHQGRVLDLIDDKVDELEKKYKFGQEVYQGCPMHNIRFGINTLKELKKELEGDDRD